MPSRIIVATAALLVSTAAMAQAGPVAKVTSQQLVCQLSGDCAQADSSLETQDKPESRGFSIARHPGTPAASSNNPAAATATPQQRATAYRAPASARNQAAPGGRYVPRGPVGRADLSINFVSGSAALTDDGREMAQTFMQALRSPQLAGKRFMIAGHTDDVGSRQLNLDLSRRRAETLVDYLVSQGATRSQFEVQGYGFDRPLPGTSAHSAKNRRVEVVKLD